MSIASSLPSWTSGESFGGASSSTTPNSTAPIAAPISTITIIAAPTRLPGRGAAAGAVVAVRVVNADDACVDRPVSDATRATSSGSATSPGRGSSGCTVSAPESLRIHMNAAAKIPHTTARHTCPAKVSYGLT